MIVATNPSFARLCRLDDSATIGRRLVDVVVESDRVAIEEAFQSLRELEAVIPGQACSLTALRATPPTIRLSIEVARLGAASPIPYLACLQTPSRRRLPRATAGLPPADGPPRTASSPQRASPAPEADTSWPSVLKTLSHEFRGPLTAIRGWVHLAGCDTLRPETLSHALEVIAHNAEHFLDMVENLFDLSRRATGSLALRRRSLDLNALTHLVVESTLPAARHRQVTLTLRRSNSPLSVHADPHRLEQVIRNLVENAIKFTPPGGNVRVRTELDGTDASIVITDTGQGIAAAALPSIFEPFRHDDSDVAPAERGLGLGLSLVRELVRLHGGDVRALSEGRDCGATFIVRLPRADQGAGAGRGAPRVTRA
jgi:two-component sensor histidine kinase